MSVQFVFGASGAGKTEYLLRKVLLEAAQDLRKDFYFIVPEQDTLGMQRKVTAHPLNTGRGILNVDVLSFRRLAYRVFEELNVRDLRIIDDMGKIMILRRVSGEVREELSVYQRQLDKPGFLSELKSQISELYQYKVQPEMIALAAEKTGSLYTRGKLRDLSLLYKAFRDYMEKQGYMTEEELLDRLYQLLPDSRLLKNAVLVFDGFTGFTPLQLDILRELLPAASRMFFALDVSADETGMIYEKKTAEDLFYLTSDTVRKLTKLCRETGTALLPAVDLNRYDAVTGNERSAAEPLPRFRKAPALSVIERELYRYGRSVQEIPVQPDSAAGDAVEIWEASDLRMELTAIAGEIERSVREEKLRYQDFGIILTDPESCRDLVFQVFEEAEIPYFLDDPADLMHSPYAETIRAALEAVDRNFTFDAVLRYLRALPRGTDAENNEIDLFENYLRESGIAGCSRYDAAWESFNGLKEKLIRPLLLMREETKGAAAVSVRVEAIRKMLAAASAKELVQDEAERLRAEGEQNRAEEILSGIDAADAVLDKLETLLGANAVGRTEFRDILDAGLSEASVRLIPATLDQVVIGDLMRSRFSGQRRFFIAGVTSDAIPKADTGVRILNDRDRKLFLDAGIMLAPDRTENALIQRFYIYRALLNPSEHLVISYALRGRNGKGRKPSGLIGTLKEILPGLTVKKLRNTSPMLCTRKEAVRMLAEELSSLPEGREDQEEHRAMLRRLSVLYRDPEFHTEAVQLLSAAFTHYTGTRLGTGIAEAVYGKVLTGSITRLELFTGCAYAHFLKYGLRLAERKTYEVQAFDIGNLYHAAIERCFRIAEEEKRTLPDYDEEALAALAARCVAEVSGSYGNRMMMDTARNRYLVRKVRDITRTTLWALAEQLRRGDFKVAALERDFDLVRDGIRLTGRIDRVDRCVDQDRIYVKVIDYKSGRTAFDLQKIYHGLQLQLVAYMNAAIQQTSLQYPGKEILPAAMFYYHIDDPVLPYDAERTGPEAAEERLRLLKMDGLVNTDAEVVKRLDRDIRRESDIMPVAVKNGMVDPARKSVASTRRFRDLAEYVDRNIGKYAAEIKAGEIAVHPVLYKRDSTACTYCPYHAVCKFDPRIEGFSYRNPDSMKPEEIWQKISPEEEAGNGNEVDR